MMKVKLLVLSILFLALSQSLQATHIAASDIYYEYVAPNQYRVHLILYRDCKPGNAGLAGTVTLRAESVSCNQNFTFQADTTGNNTRKIYGDLCPNIVNWCQNAASQFPAYEEWHYDGIVNLPMACTDWQFKYNNNCCRNVAIGNLQNPGSAGICVFARLNNVARPINNSAFLSVKPIPYVCVNQPKTYLNGPVDPDLDSLVFVPAQPLNWTTCLPINWTGGAITANPFGPAAPGGYMVDPNTGTATFTPIATGTYAMAFQCYEVDPITGDTVGSVMRDVQLNVLNCAGAPPSDPNGTQNYNILNLVGANLVTPIPISMEICAGATMSFDVQAISNANTNTVLASSNNAISCPGSNFSFTPVGGGNPVTASFSWTPNISQVGNHTLVITFIDSSCTVAQPIVLKSYCVILIKVLPGIDAGPDLYYCPDGDSVQFNISAPAGISLWQWTDINGNTSNIGITDLNIQNPKAAPSVTTTYIVKALNPPPGIICKTQDTIMVIIDNSNWVDATASPDVLCEAGISVLTATPAGPVPVYQCGEENVSCATPFNQYISGIGANTNNTLSPFNCTYAGGRTQIIYTVADMNAMGILKGRIDSIALDIASKTSNLGFDMYIKMGCTNQTQLTGFMVPSNLKTVYQNTNYVTSVGWNSFPLQTPFLWDGTKNLLVEICFFNPSGLGFGSSDPVRYSFVGSPQFYTQSSNFGGCILPFAQNPTGPVPASILPNMRFSLCDIPAKTWEYHWEPTNLVSDSTTAVTNGTVTTTTTFTVSTRGGNNCLVQDSVTVSHSIHGLTVTPLDTTICEGDAFPAIATGFGNTNSETFLWYDQNGGSSGLSCTTCSTPTIRPVGGGDFYYTCTRLDSYNCGDTVTIHVKTFPKPSVTILNGDSITIKYQQEVTLIATGAKVYSWTTLDGTGNPLISKVKVSPAEPTMYYVYGIDENGCGNVDSIWVDIDYSGNLFVPSAFTPNGDGKNDVFRIAGFTFQNVQEFRVLNRWGQEIFAAGDNRGWDGTFKGKEQDPGVYFYLIRVTYPDGKTLLFKGDVTLIR
jgi:gliding motility-associated-like protein